MFRRVTQRESSIEATCRVHAAARGYQLKKLTDGIGDPDRLLVLPSGRVAFVEFKRPGETASRIQRYRALELSKLEHVVYVVDSVGAFDNLMDDLEHQWKLRAPYKVEPPPRDF